MSADSADRRAEMMLFCGWIPTGAESPGSIVTGIPCSAHNRATRAAASSPAYPLETREKLSSTNGSVFGPHQTWANDVPTGRFVPPSVHLLMVGVAPVRPPGSVP